MALLFVLLFILLLFVLWMIVHAMLRAIEWRIQRRKEERGPAGFGFPVIGDFQPNARPAIAIPNDGPGRYRIIGVIAASGADTKMYIEAETLANAKVKAELKGVIVTDIEKSPERAESCA